MTPQKPHVECVEARILHFSGLLHCDDVSVVFDAPKPGHGMVMLRQFQTAWTAYWVDLGADETPLDRVLSLPPAEFVESLVWGTPTIVTRERNKERANLMHLISQITPLLEKYRKEACHG